MSESCKIFYRGVNGEGQRLPRLFSYGRRPLIDTARLTAPIREKVEVGLAMGILALDPMASTIKRIPTLAGSIKTWVSEKPYQTALLAATGTLAIGVIFSAITDCNIILAEKNIAAVTTSQAQLSTK